MRRDVGTGLLHARDDSQPRLALLGSPTAQALRAERGSLVAWLLGVGAFAFVLGVIANSISSAGLSQSTCRSSWPSSGRARSRRPRATSASRSSSSSSRSASSAALRSRPRAARRASSSSRRCSRSRSAAAAGSRDGSCSPPAPPPCSRSRPGCSPGPAPPRRARRSPLPRLLKAGANCLPAALLFLGLGALAFGTLPRAATGIAYGLTSLAFVWELFGRARRRAGLGARPCLTVPPRRPDPGRAVPGRRPRWSCSRSPRLAARRRSGPSAVAT